MTAPKRKREVQLNFRVSPEELAMIEQKMAPAGHLQPGSISAKNGFGRLCGAPGTAGAEGAGLPDALFQQQLKPAGPPCA